MTMAHLGSLARTGIRFTDGHVSGPYCSPTRAGLMTGRYQQRFGLQESFGFLGGAHSYFPASDGLETVLRGTEPVREEAYLTDAFAREAAAFLERHKPVQPTVLNLWTVSWR